MIKLTKRVIVSPAYDARPKSGIHGAHILFALVHPTGAVHFEIGTNWQLPHVRHEQHTATLEDAQVGASLTEYSTLKVDWNDLFKAARLEKPKPRTLDRCHLECVYDPQPWDVGWHSPVQRLPEEQHLHVVDYCHVLNGKCYGGGSSLAAEPLFALLVEKGDAAVWEELKKYWVSVFGKKENDGSDRIRQIGTTAYPIGERGL